MKEALFVNAEAGVFIPPKIKNGSQIRLGNQRAFTVIVDKHFNRFQKKMIKWCFGFVVTDYSEERSKDESTGM